MTVPSSETRSPRIRSSSRARRRIVRRIACVKVLEQRPDFEPAVIAGRVRPHRLDDRRGGQAVDALDGVDALDVAGDRAR